MPYANKRHLLSRAKNADCSVIDPATRATWKMTLGAALVAEGLFGVMSRMSDHLNPFDRRGSAAGLPSAMFAVMVGAIFVVGGMVAAPNIPDDELRVTGTIYGGENYRNDDGQTMYRSAYTYTDNTGTDHRFTGGFGSSSPPNVGADVEIGYSAAQPNNARRIGGLDGHFHLIFIAVGAIVGLAGLWGAAISIALIAVGMSLFRTGRAERHDSGTTDSVAHDLLDIIKDRDRIAEVVRQLLSNDTSVATPGTAPDAAAGPADAPAIAPAPPAWPPAG